MNLGNGACLKNYVILGKREFGNDSCFVKHRMYDEFVGSDMYGSKTYRDCEERKRGVDSSVHKPAINDAVSHNLLFWGESIVRSVMVRRRDHSVFHPRMTMMRRITTNSPVAQLA